MLFVLQTNDVVDPSTKLLTSEVVELLSRSYRNSEHAMLTASRIEEISLFVSSFTALHMMFYFLIRFDGFLT